MKQRIFSALLCALLLLSLSGCGKTVRSDYPSLPDLGALSFSPTLFYANNGVFSFAYDADKDEIEWREDSYEVVAAEKKEGYYSLAISYEQGTRDLDAAEKDLRQQINDGRFVRIGETEPAAVCGAVECRVILCNTEDGSASHIRFGNTESGYFELFDVISVNADDGQAAHLQELLSTVSFLPIEAKNAPEK